MINTNNSDFNSSAPSEKKQWQYVQVAPCPHVQGRFYALQELLGSWDWDHEEQKTKWKPAALPAATRVVYMEMDDKGYAKNVNSNSSGYDGGR